LILLLITLNFQMEEQTSQIIEISMDVPTGEGSTGGSKFCGEAACGFSDAESNSKDAKERSASMRKLLMAVTLCVIFMSVEVAGGIEANSLAILTDAAHLLSDVASFAISLFSLWAASWEATPRQSYGFFRVEILGALVSIQLIWLLAGILVYEAILRLIHDTSEVNGFLMFIVATFGLVVNIIMVLLLGHDHGHGHGHGHDGHGHGHGHGHDDHGHGTSHTHGVTISAPHQHHQHEEHPEDEHCHGHEDPADHHAHEDPADHHAHEDPADHQGHEDPAHHHGHEDHAHHHGNPAEPLLDKPKNGNEQKKRNINVQGAYLHVLGDSIQSIGVMIGGAIIWYNPKWKIVDVICTLIFSVIVLGTTIKMIRNILDVLMENTPREIDATKLERGLLEMDEVVAIHELHIWAITVGKVLLACHVKIRPEANADLVLDNVINYIRREYNISHVTVQIER
jgi:zinc transporter 2